MDTELGLIAVLIAVVVCLIPIFVIFFSVNRTCKTKNPNVKSTRRTKAASVMIIAGSGGHTKEILSLVSSFGSHYSPRYYIVANTDKMSRQKIEALEAKEIKLSNREEYSIHTIPRSREVSQSWFTTVLSTASATLYSFPLVFRLKPEVILCNGPGTCIPLCVAGLVLKIFRDLKIVYIESICRVETLSLSGKILYYLADSLLVQWPSLHQKYPRSTYIGRLV
ncbi:hypothetical protein CHS0354_038318 [Potamilus streckersoni]|uniref:UDP-N-acetylglucosamine transferase subunit ALG14 n=1 Tax=Potamilus streckersoni TaxID=2493646 RepID=A0AAE0S739_9BIVA|nr:hypothetical protein CHS0354_038318 [Potamilus streckersoni]